MYTGGTEKTHVLDEGCFPWMGLDVDWSCDCQNRILELGDLADSCLDLV